MSATLATLPGDHRRGDTARPVAAQVLPEHAALQPHLTAPRAHPLNPLRRDLLAKMEMEAAMVASPQDTGLRHAYFDLLVQLATSRTGLLQAVLPEIGHPLYFRCGSSDVANLVQVFRDGSMDFTMRATPLSCSPFQAAGAQIPCLTL